MTALDTECCYADFHR